MTEKEWVPFSTRYGFMRHRSDVEHLASRHARVDGDPYHGCELDPRLLCACPGGSGAMAGCCARATQEDRLCEGCREYCWAVDEAKNYHRLIDIYGASDGRVVAR